MWPMFLAPLPGEGPKGQISLKFNSKVNFRYFLNQTLCVLSQIKDIKHIRKGVSVGRLGHAPGGTGGQKLNFSTIQSNLVFELLT